MKAAIIPLSYLVFGLFTRCCEHVDAALTRLRRGLSLSGNSESRSLNKGCCSQNFKSCITWCGDTKESCGGCNPDEIFSWLGSGRVEGCFARWGGCTTNSNGCCPGLECVENSSHYSQCLPPFGGEHQDPTSEPTPMPMESKPASTTSPTDGPTKLRTDAPTTKPTTRSTFDTVQPSPAASPPSELFRTNQAMLAWDIFESLTPLTYEVPSTNRYTLAYVASGGVAGSGDSVVTESQAYALFITGSILASWSTHAGAQGREESDRQIVLQAFYGYFNGWATMCQNSNQGASCQEQKWCEAYGIASVCLPHWKQKADFTEVQGTGAAPDGDEDAIAGILLALAAVSNDGDKPEWYDMVSAWADASIAAFMEYNTIAESGHRLLKLGSCWGGWGSSGNNPSYHSPGSYKLMRDYHLGYHRDPVSSYPSFSADEFDNLIHTSYMVLFGVQCETEGMVPNWARVVESADGKEITSDGGSFSGSGTPQYEFGAEAARTIWRISLDAAVTAAESSLAKSFLEPILTQLKNGYRGDSSWDSNSFQPCTAENMSSDIYMFFSGWLNNAFIFAPIVSALVVPLDGITIETQQELIDAAGTKLSTNLPSGYYARSWALLGNLALNGALESATATAKSAVTGSPPVIIPVPVPTPTTDSPFPTPAPVPSPSPESQGCCSQNFKDCITWCGTTETTCGSCDSSESFQWLPMGSKNNCIARWSECTHDATGCCDGLSCVGNQYHSQCTA